MRTGGPIGVQCVEGRVVLLGDVLGSASSGTGDDWDESVNKVLDEAKAGAQSVVMVVEIGEERVNNLAGLLEPATAAASRTPTVAVQETLSRAPSLAAPLETGNEEHIMSGANIDPGRQSRAGIATPAISVAPQPPAQPTGSMTGNMSLQADATQGSEAPRAASHAEPSAIVGSRAEAASGRGSRAPTVGDQTQTETGEAQMPTRGPGSITNIAASQHSPIRQLSDILAGEDAGGLQGELPAPAPVSVRSASRRSVRSVVPA